jgi:phage tail sheath protein FI
MPANVIRKTPGVYITEVAAFPPSIVGVPTAVPAFIGYTKKAETADGKPAYNQPIQIGSMAEFESIFGAGYQPLYSIQHILSSPDARPASYDFKVSYEQELFYFNLVEDSSLESQSSPHSSGSGASAGSGPQPPPQPLARFNLYNSMRLFYANGGSNCWVVSVGSYQDAANGIDPDALLGGLDVIGRQSGPTMLLVPEAILLPSSASDPGDRWQAPAEYWSIVNAMIGQAAALQDRVALLDVYGTQYATPETLDSIVEAFQSNINTDPSSSLSYGIAYFPFLMTSVVQPDEVNFQNIAPESLESLQEILSMENYSLYGSPGATSPPHRPFNFPSPPGPFSPNFSQQKRFQQVETCIQWMTDPATTATKAQVRALNQNLVAALPLLGQIETIILNLNQVLPPSAAMAGIYTASDLAQGVWNAPANIALQAVTQPTINITDDQQEDLNVPVNGMAIDAIRQFTGRGTVVWGARTLDGNSQDFRYVQVRRTLIYIEQSVKNAMNQFVFAANDGNTWSTVTAMISSFLQNLWSQGGLMGDTASEAFSVQCGLGSTMTSQDILNGYMRVQVSLQMIRPAEFIELTFTQTMQGTGSSTAS